MDNPLLLLGILTLFASIPIVVWLIILFKKSEKNRKTVALIFFLGCLTAPALLGLQYFWEIFPRFNLETFIQENVHGQNQKFLAIFLLFAALEEIFKMYIIVAIDKKQVLVKTIDDAIKYALTSALAFAFIENIYYLYTYWNSTSIRDLAGIFIFRSLFTACAHMIFSGIFGYYYGIGKFSIDITQQQKIMGQSHRIAKAISRVFNIPLSHAYQQQMIIKGPIIAILMHVAYNYLLQINKILPVIIFVILGYLFLQFLLNRKAGNMILVSDLSTSQRSTLAKKDEDVVVDLLGLWFKEKKYVDVLHICERLLERDPSNNVVKIFKAKAMDKLDDKDTYKGILNTIIKTGEDLSANDKNIITKHLTEKENLKKIKEKIKIQMQKEGRKFIDPEKKKSNTNNKIAKPEDDILKDYTGDGTFRMGG